jgi:hypothetical protein
MRVNVFVVTCQFSLVILLLRSFAIINSLNLLDVNDCVVKREMQDARSASHVIRGAISQILLKTVLCNVTQLFVRGKSVTLGCHPLQGRGPITQVDQKGADENFDSAQDTNLTLQSANEQHASVLYVWINQ